nr:unnamed protein product [Callosobruchus analis]
MIRENTSKIFGLLRFFEFQINKETPNPQCLNKGPKTTLRLFLISTVTLIIEATILVVLLIFRQFLWLFLTLKYGERFGGLMAPGDSVWMTHDDSSHTTQTIVFFDSKLTAAEFNDFFLKSITDNPWRHNDPVTDLKLTCTYDFCMGYAFYLKDHLKKSDCAVTLNVGGASEEFLEKSELTDVLSQCGNRPLPLNNKCLWEAVTLNKPLRTEDMEKGVYTYVVIFRSHHSMGDGMSIVNFLLRNLADDQRTVHSNLKKLVRTMNKRDVILGKPGVVNTIKNTLKLVKFVLISPTVIREEQLRFMNNTNSLHGPRLSGEKHIVYSTESSEERLLDAMKQMKNGVPGATFNVVALTAVSRAMQRYFDMNCKNTPSSLIATMPLPMSVPEVKTKIKLQNSLSTAQLFLPMLRSQATVREQMAAVVGQVRAITRKPDVVVRYLMIHGFVGYLPRNIIRTFLTASGVATFSFSNIPGLPATECCQHKMRDIIFITPNLTKCGKDYKKYSNNLELQYSDYQKYISGLGFSMITYRGTLSLGLIVDRSLIPFKQAAQGLLDSTCPKYAIPPKLVKKESVAILLFLISLVLLIMLAPVLILFAILRTVANVILKVKHGKNYGGLVEREIAWLKTEDMPFINIFMMQQSQISSPEAFVSHVRQCLCELLSQSNAQKLTSVCKFFMGYAYYLNNQVTADFICNTITVDNEKDFLDKNDLTDILSDLASKPMPKDNSGLFEVLVVNKPLKRVDHDSCKYAVIFRVDHIVADGLGLTAFFFQSLADDQEQLKRSFKELIAKFDNSKTKKAQRTGWQRITQILRYIKMFMVYFLVILVNRRSFKDENCLHGPILSGKKIAAYAVEKKGEDLMLAVKQIKRRVTGSTFSSVVLTAISRKEAKSPNFLKVMMTAALSVLHMDQTPILANNFSLAELDLPIFKKSEDVDWQIGLMEKYWNEVKEKPDFHVNYLMAKYIFGLIPIPLMKQFFSAVKITMSVSFTILTYDNKFQIGLTVDKVFDCKRMKSNR